MSDITELLRDITPTPGELDLERVHRMVDGVDVGSDRKFVQATLDKDPAATAEEALLEFYRRLRPGDPPNADNAR